MGTKLTALEQLIRMRDGLPARSCVSQALRAKVAAQRAKLAREMQLLQQAQIVAKQEELARVAAEQLAIKAAEEAQAQATAVLSAVKLAEKEALAAARARANVRAQARKQFKQERLTALGIIEMGEKLDVQLRQFRERRGPLLRREFVDGCNEIYGTPLMVENLSYLKGTWPFVSHPSWSKENSGQRRFMAAENLRNRTEQRL
jgi:hypothetical protein